MVTGCSQISNPLKVVTSSVKSEGETNGVVHLNWVAPKEKTTFYLLKFGSSSGKLDTEVKIPIGEIEKVTHPKHGLVYRYTVTDLNPSERFFFSLRAGNTAGISKQTPVSEEKVRTKLSE